MFESSLSFVENIDSSQPIALVDYNYANNSDHFVQFFTTLTLQASPLWEVLKAWLSNLSFKSDCKKIIASIIILYNNCLNYYIVFEHQIASSTSSQSRAECRQQCCWKKPPTERNRKKFGSVKTKTKLQKCYKLPSNGHCQHQDHTSWHQAIGSSE